MDIPEYPFFEVSRPEVAFGCAQERYLDMSKKDAHDLCSLIPEETEMANLLFVQGHLGEEQYGMAGREYAVEATPEQVRDTTGALLRSFGPSHELKIATVAVAMHRWFPKAALAEMGE